MNTPAAAAIRQVMAAATAALRSGDPAAAQTALLPFFNGALPPNPDLLNIAGTLRMHQGRLGDAAGLFEQAVSAAPREPIFAFNLGLTRSRLGQVEAAEAAFRACLTHKPDFAQALLELGALLHRTGKLDEAEDVIRRAIRLAPASAHAHLALGAVLLEAERPADAEDASRRGLATPQPLKLHAQLQMQLAQALRRQRKDDEALEALDTAEALDPSLPGLARHRAEALQNLNRFDDAVAIFQAEIARTPADPALHLDYNALLYQLGRSDALLQSFEQAPASRELLLGKAHLLARQQQHDQALAIYAGLRALDGRDRLAATGEAQLLTRLGRHDEAIAAFDTVLAQQGGDAGLYSLAAEPALLNRDPQKAAWLCEQGLMKDARSASCLAMLSIASRMLEDGRDEALNGYDTLVRSFDLEPPQGFSSMESFNAELNASLDRLHPKSGELIDQSLRKGTQTPGHLFPAGLALVTLLKQRIDETVARYIAELDDDAAHPFLARRRRNFRYSGSWSSRLEGGGFHVNHFHPDGWISSCYYIAVPQAVQDETGKQGWIKFGEPSFDVPLKQPIRRSLQPAPGRLVLFPSHMWHGTVPFQDHSSRTTIAFDVVPAD